MPERWERELSKLRVLDANERLVQGRVARGPSSPGAPRHERVIAGIVAGVVAIAGLAFLWTALPTGEAPLGGDPGDLPVLSITFQTNGTIEGNPEPYTRRIDTRIAYGEASDQSFTTTTPPDAVLDMVNAEDVTPFLPGPTAGSPIAFEADGEAPRALIGTLADWPDFERFTQIERLPESPGDYILVFEADYPEGIGRTARRVQVVEPSVLQLVLRETGDEQALSGNAYVDGRGAEGFLSETSFTEGDAGPLEKAPEAPTFSPEAWLDIEPGSPVMLVTSATTASSGTFDSYDAFVAEADLPNDLLAGVATIDGSGRVLLAVEATWVHPDPGSGKPVTSERALFFFPIEVVPVIDPPEPTSMIEPSPTADPNQISEPSPSVDPSVEAAPALRVRCSEDGSVDVLTPVVAAQRDGLHVLQESAAGLAAVVYDDPDPLHQYIHADGYAAFATDGDERESVISVPPGALAVACYVMDGPVGTDVLPPGTASVQLIDPEAWFVPYQPRCDATDHETSTIGLSALDPNDAEALIRKAVPGIESTDVIEPAGYPTDAHGSPWWRVSRDGRIIAALMVSSAGGGHANIWSCRSSGIHGDRE